MDDVKSAANALNDRDAGLEFEVSVGSVKDLEEGFVSPRARDNLMGTKLGFDDPTGGSQRPWGLCGCLTLAYYQPYFDVDTADVQERVLRALLPMKQNPTFAELVVAKPDAYGPLWLSTTLIFSIALCSNVASYMDYTGDRNEWSYDFSLVASACTLVEIFLVGVPVVLWVVGKYFNIPMTLSFLLCAYGYSTTVFIPASFICMLPVDALDWVSMLLAMAWSLSFLLSNLLKVFADLIPKEKLLPFLGLVSACHLTWTMIVKLMFF